MDPITQKAGGGGAEIVKKMMEQGAGAPGQTPGAPGQAGDVSKFEKLRMEKAGETDPTRKIDDPTKTQMQPSQKLAGFLDKVNSGQHDLDKIVKDLQSGKEFDMKELMAMQLQVQQLSQQMSMTTKLIGKAIENINKAINTQV